MIVHYVGKQADVACFLFEFEGRGGDNAHPCAVSPKMAIRGHFTLASGLLPK